jgi:hypothetical protein
MDMRVLETSFTVFRQSWHSDWTFFYLLVPRIMLCALEAFDSRCVLLRTLETSPDIHQERVSNNSCY